MSSSGPANAQARKLLQTLCKFLIPLAQSLDMKTINNLDNIPLGVEADEFISELEIFIFGAQHRKMDPSLKITISKDPLDYVEGADWFWETPYVENQGSSPPSEIHEARGTFASNSEDQSEVSLFKQLPKQNAGFPIELYRYTLREKITKLMPIRVLLFEQHGSDLNISLVDRNGVYDHLCQKLLLSFARSTFDAFEWTENHVKYAILSHTWNQTPGELIYNDWQTGSLNAEDPKCHKLVNFCEAAHKNHGLNFGWIDTVCINKDSSSELDESIRSMYKWYQNAQVCITYLAETNSLLDMPRDNWFTRGWTLQELVAPNFIKFYNKHWAPLVSSEANDKNYPPILNAIESATQIRPDELDSIHKLPISRRMEVAARRRVTREEDTAYSLMGIFDVSISTAYGEGLRRAFFRLLKEILDTNKDVSDIFNWGAGIGSTTSPITSLFPFSPAFYADRSRDPQLRPWRSMEPLTLTHLGLRTPVLLMSAIPSFRLRSAHQPIGDYHATVNVKKWPGESYHLFQNRDFTNALGTLNVEQHSSDGNSVRILKTCFAILLMQEQDGPNSLGRYKKIHTRKPIVFTLEKTAEDEHDEDRDYFVVDKDQLGDHGMKLVTLYL